MTNVPEDLQAIWGAFAAGAFLRSPQGDPTETWRKLHAELLGLSADHNMPGGGNWENLREWAAAWAVANLPAELVLSRRWF